MLHAHISIPNFLELQSLPLVCSEGLQALVRGGRNQANVVFALVFKELKQKFSSGRLGVLWAFAEPVVHMLILSSLWYFIGRETINEISILLFVASGIFPFLIVRKCISTVPRAIVKNRTLLDYPQVKPIDAVIASFLVEMVVLVIAAVGLYSGLHWFFGFTPEIPRPLEAMGVLGILFCGGFGIALFLSVLGCFDEGAFSIARMAGRPLLFISAVFYGAAQLPPEVLSILKWNPLLQLIEYYRHYFLGNKLFEQADIIFPSAVAFSLIVTGFMYYYRNRYILLQR